MHLPIGAAVLEMVKLTEEMKNEINKSRLVPLATASASGEPNVVPIGMFFLKNDETLWIVDNFMQKTLKNVLANPKVSLYVWSPEAKDSYQIKGTVTVVTSGAELAEAKAFADSKRPGMPTKGLLKMKITEVYSVSPGPNAGKKLL